MTNPKFQLITDEEKVIQFLSKLNTAHINKTEGCVSGSTDIYFTAVLEFASRVTLKEV